MSYSEENGQVILRMSREDYEGLMTLIEREIDTTARPYRPITRTALIKFLNRLNSGNPNYTSYQVGDKS